MQLVLDMMKKLISFRLASGFMPETLEDPGISQEDDFAAEQSGRIAGLAALIQDLSRLVRGKISPAKTRIFECFRYGRVMGTLARMLAAGAVAMALSGCAVGGLGSLMGGGAGKLTTSSINSSNMSEKTLSMAANDMSPVTVAAGGPGSCPPIRLWQDNANLTIYEIGRVGDNLAIRHRGEIIRLARECDISPTAVKVKYGVAGRVLLGPAGRPGTITLPVKVNIAGRDGQLVQSQKLKVKVRISDGRPFGNFSTVSTISFPLQAGSKASDYRIFVTFDHNTPGAGPS